MSDKNVTLKVNGKDVVLNHFVNAVFANVIDGLVDSLDKVPEKKDKIEIIVE